MSITYVKGDLFKHVQDNDCIIHVCNNIDRFGSGFAAAMTAFAPIVKEAYHEWFKEPGDCCLENINVTTGSPTLGNIQIVNYFYYIGDDTGKTIKVVNMIAQDGVIGKNNPHPLHYNALAICLEHVLNRIPKYMRIIAPKFGSGLAGGDWQKISEMVGTIFGEKDRDITIFEI